MEAIKQTIDALSLHFHYQMGEFQKNLHGAIPAASPTCNIAGQFSTFRTFVLSAPAGLQQQLEMVAKQTDQLEMRSRRKMLLVHGIREGSDDNLAATVSASLSKHLELPHLREDCFSRCQRLGRLTGDKPRPILLKFQKMWARNLVWFAKTALKGTGIMLTEFLTKNRHEVFLMARKKHGITRCFIRDGIIVVIGQDGLRHRLTSMSELNSIQVQDNSQDAPSGSSAPKAPKSIKPAANIYERVKRNVKKT